MISKKLTVYTSIQILIFFGLTIFASTYFKGCYDHDSNCDQVSTTLLVTMISLFLIISLSTTCFLCIRERRQRIGYALI